MCPHLQSPHAVLSAPARPARTSHSPLLIHTTACRKMCPTGKRFTGGGSAAPNRPVEKKICHSLPEGVSEVGGLDQHSWLGETTRIGRCYGKWLQSATQISLANFQWSYFQRNGRFDVCKSGYCQAFPAELHCVKGRGYGKGLRFASSIVNSFASPGI